MQQRDEEHALGAKNSVTSPTPTLIQGDKTVKGEGGKGWGGKEVCLLYYPADFKKF